MELINVRVMPFLYSYEKCKKLSKSCAHHPPYEPPSGGTHQRENFAPISLKRTEFHVNRYRGIILLSPRRIVNFVSARPTDRPSPLQTLTKVEGQRSALNRRRTFSGAYTVN
ncbi:hypothetical protein EVAR_33330_1 [Eumeta japonica]|uniref:Uncharacterized protein n=1 Tax=Eumeta variegata TaxID=151549 RepID=A0A4C1YMA6_EUMVA|nr:hypothetical protein EVAR_33330_1 [Eumeta japonica]